MALTMAMLALATPVQAHTITGATYTCHRSGIVGTDGCPDAFPSGSTYYVSEPTDSFFFENDGNTAALLTIFWHGPMGPVLEVAECIPPAGLLFPPLTPNHWSSEFGPNSLGGGEYFEITWYLGCQPTSMNMERQIMMCQGDNDGSVPAPSNSC